MLPSGLLNGVGTPVSLISRLNSLACTYPCQRFADVLTDDLTVALDEVSGLDEHAARAAGGVVDLAVVGLDDLDDQFDDRGRCEELAGLRLFALGRIVSPCDHFE